MHIRVSALVAAIVCASLVSCSPASTGTEGDCNADLSLQGDRYRVVNGLQTPHRGDRIGTGTWLDCEGDPAPDLGEAQVYAIRGQDSSRLVIVAHEDEDSVFMNDAIRWRQRPQLVKDSERYLTCSGPTRFTGTWNYVEPEDMPDMEDYGSARVPYTGNFTTSKGTGVSLDKWSTVTLRAEITSDTEPIPSTAFLEQATSGNVSVAVAAVCHGESFQVEAIRLDR